MNSKERSNNRTLLSLAHEYKYGRLTDNKATDMKSVVSDQYHADAEDSDDIHERCENILEENRRIRISAVTRGVVHDSNMEKSTGRSNPVANHLSINADENNDIDNDSISSDDNKPQEDPETFLAIKDPINSSPSTSSLPPGHVPPYRAVFLISNAALGAGLLNFPQAYMQAGGIDIAITVQLILLIFIIGAFLIIARVANKSQASTYQDIVLYMLGSKFKVTAQILIAIYFFGSAITYVIIIGEQLSSVVMYATGQRTAWYSNRTFLFTLFSLMFLLPLCLPRRLKALSYTSFFGGIGAFFITSVIIINYVTGSYKPNPKDPEVLTDWKSAFAAVPVICFGFQCHVSSVVVYSELKNRSMPRFIGCALVAMTICTVTYALSGSFGYKTFGKSTKADILENYSDSDTLVNVARISILFILLSSFAIVSFCARTVIDGFIVQIGNYGITRAEQTERPRRITITICWFILVLTLAAVVPNIGVAIAMIGGVAALFIFTFPGLCLLKSIDLTKSRLSMKDRLLIVISGIYLILGMFIFGEVTTLAITQDINARHIQ